MIKYDGKLKIFYSNKINDDRFFSGFGTRLTGDGRNVTNIFSFFGNSKVRLKKLIVPEQIHSTNVVYYSLDDETSLPGIAEQATESTMISTSISDTDAVVTAAVNVALTVKTGDCVPIIFVDKSAGMIGISHQGWRGSLKKLPVKVVEKMIEKGAKKEKMVVAIGPAIGACCYDISDDRYYSFIEEFDGYANKIFSTRGGKKYLNLSLLNYLFLIDCGIKKENIDFFPFCTSCDKERFFSYRRDFKKKLYSEMFSFVEIIS